MQLEDHGMICNIVCPPMVSKVLKARHTAKLMNGTQFLSDGFFIKHETKHTIFIARLKSAFECTKHMCIDACPTERSV